MTEKRFEAYFDNHMNDWKVQDNLTLDIYPCVSQKVAEAFTELLNGLYCSDLKLLKSNDFLLKENEELKQVNRNLGDFRKFITEQNVSNEKERKNLQLQMLRLYNYFENYFEDTMNPTSFSEMWDNVKEDEKWEKRGF